MLICNKMFTKMFVNICLSVSVVCRFFMIIYYFSFSLVVSYVRYQIVYDKNFDNKDFIVIQKMYFFVIN